MGHKSGIPVVLLKNLFALPSYWLQLCLQYRQHESIIIHNRLDMSLNTIQEGLVVLTGSNLIGSFRK